jgi:hypothetical protein
MLFDLPLPNAIGIRHSLRSLFDLLLIYPGYQLSLYNVGIALRGRHRGFSLCRLTQREVLHGCRSYLECKELTNNWTCLSDGGNGICAGIEWRDPFLPSVEDSDETIVANTHTPLPVTTPGKLAKWKSGIFRYFNVLMRPY